MCGPVVGAASAAGFCRGGVRSCLSRDPSRAAIRRRHVERRVAHERIADERIAYEWVADQRVAHERVGDARNDLVVWNVCGVTPVEPRAHRLLVDEELKRVAAL